MHPYLTSIDIAIHELGQRGTLALINQLKHQDQPVSGMRIVIPHQLIERETVKHLN